MSTKQQTLVELAQIDVSTIREEALARMNAQQNLINYTFILLGVLATFLGITGQSFSPIGELLVLLTGPILCTFLQAVYLKHQLYIELIAGYITTNINPYIDEESDNLKQKLYTHWDTYLASVLSKRPISFISKFLGAAEAFFPIVVGLLCLFIYPYVQSSFTITPPWFFRIWRFADFIPLVVVAYFAYLIRWQTEKRHNELAQNLQKSHT